MPPSMQRRKWALFVFFFIPGLALASWVTRTPAIRDAIGASIAQMGMVLGGLSVGAMTGVLISSRIIRLRGTRFTMLLGLTLVCLSMLLMTAGAVAASQPFVGIGLAFFGLGAGMAEIAINMDAALVEQTSGSHVMHILHGCFSLGTLVGALLGLAANAWHVPIGWHLACIFAVTASLLIRFAQHVPGGYGQQTATASDSPLPRSALRSVLADRRVQMIGCVVFSMALTEGAAYDWLPILLVDEHGFSAATSSMIFVVFACMMTLGRFGGSVLLQRFGRVAVVRTSIDLAGLGIACIALGQSQWLAGVAVLCWGIGASLGFPMALSAAAEGGGDMNKRVEVVAILGYVALLVGPPTLGFAGQAFGLRGAMLIVLAFVVLAVWMTPSMRTPPTQHGQAM